MFLSLSGRDDLTEHTKIYAVSRLPRSFSASEKRRFLGPLDPQRLRAIVIAFQEDQGYKWHT